VKTLQAIGVSVVLIAGLGASASAQPATDPNYVQSAQDYQSQRDAYAVQRQTYDAQRDTYEAQRRTYERQKHAYERRRAEYDAQYGPGAYARYYGPEPVYAGDRGPD
jgi:hypothetical protein